MAQRDTLRRLGCDEGQGYLFGMPMPAREFGETFGVGQGPERRWSFA